MSLNVSDFSFLCKNCDTLKKVTPLLQQPPSRNLNPTELSLFENLVGGLTFHRRKKGSHYEIMIIFKKNCQTKTKPVVRGYIYWLEGMYTMSDGKNKLLLHCYANIES